MGADRAVAWGSAEGTAKQEVVSAREQELQPTHEYRNEAGKPTANRASSDPFPIDHITPRMFPSLCLAVGERISAACFSKTDRYFCVFSKTNIIVYETT